MSNLGLSSLTLLGQYIGKLKVCSVVWVCVCVGGCVHNVSGWVDGVYVVRNVAARSP